MKRVSKIECRLCGKMVRDDTESKIEHMYHAHPLQAFSKLLTSIPNLRGFGEMFAQNVRKRIER